MDAAQVPLRQQTRGMVRDLIGRAAVTLFLEKGYDATTVDDVAAAVGTSRRTLFNYFRGKEDLALYALDEQGSLIAERTRQAPARMDAWQALRTGFGVLEELPISEQERLRVARLLFTTDSLRPGHAEKQERWRELLTPAVLERLPAGPDRLLRARAVVVCAVTCLHLANREWVDVDGERGLMELYDAAVAQVRS